MRHQSVNSTATPSHPVSAPLGRSRLIVLALAWGALVGTALGADPAKAEKSAKSAKSAKSENAAKSDSLKALDVMITIELESGNRILQLKDPEWMDSLHRAGTGIRRDRFDRMVGDTGVAREMRTVEEFRAYWSKLEERNGFKSMKGQYAAQDIDKTLVPKIYLFDSAVVLFPGWVVLRKKAKR